MKLTCIRICQSLASKTKMIIKFLPLLSNFYKKLSTFTQAKIPKTVL